MRRRLLVARDCKKNPKTGGVFKPEELEVLFSEAAKEYLDGLSCSSPRDEVTPEAICIKHTPDKEMRGRRPNTRPPTGTTRLPPKTAAARKTWKR